MSAAWWIGFHISAGALLLADLTGMRRDPCTSLHKSLRWALAWLALAIALAVLLLVFTGRDLATQFAAGYLLEQALSVDNLVLFLVIFRAFQVPAIQQHRVLTWGVLGAIAMRAAMLLGGLKLLTAFHWVTYVFGVIVLVSGLAMLRSRPESAQPGWLRWLLHRFPPQHANDDHSFFTHTATGRRATQLLLALLAVEVTDLVFALDSIPAVLAISRHAFVVYSSNILAVLSLRSLFPAVVGALRRFYWLHWGVAAILVFVGAKMLLSERWNFGPLPSLAVIAAALAICIAGSLAFPRQSGAVLA